MDKLLNISREGGFPLCAETLQVIYDNARAVNVLLTGLNLPNKSAVILGAEDFSTAITGYRYMFAVNNNKRRLVRYTMGSGVDLSSAKVTITEELHDVTDSNEQTISSVYAYERAVIESTSDANEKWKFYNLKDVLEPGIWTDLLPELRTQLENTNVSLDDNYGNILCKNDRKLRMKLKLLWTDSTNHGLGFFLSLNGIGVPGTFPLNAAVFINGVCYSVDAILNNGQLNIYTKRAYELADSDVTHWVIHSARVIINSELML